jgi:thiamine-phosphate pyrophosphorylase
VRLVQLRAKTSPAADMLALAERLAAHTREAGAVFVVNDRLDVALLAGADGLHVGQRDLTPSAVRRAVAAMPSAAGLMIGYSTHNEAQLREGLDEPVSYLAIGPVFATTTKAEPDPVIGLEGVARAARHTHAARVPLVAIGGIDDSNARSVIDAGADVVAVASELTTSDAGARVRVLIQLLQSS